MAFFRAMLRRALVRLLVEGTVQRVAVDGHDVESDDAVDRPQDYGFAASPDAGSFAWVLEVDGHRIVLRTEAASGRPALAPGEVSVWHRDGHELRMKAGGLIEAKCARLVAEATQSVRFVTPEVVSTGPIRAPNIPT